MYWSSDEDVRSDFVADAISRDRFEQILSFLHFTDNMKLDKNEEDKNMSLFRFRQQIVLSYIKGAPIGETKGCPRVYN